MNRRSILLPSMLVIACVTGAVMGPAHVAAQSQQAQPQNAPRPEQMASAPYKPVVITLPERSKDPSFEAFRRQLAAVAERKDRAALARLIVRKGFFWEREGGEGVDAEKSGAANFATAIGLDNPDDPDIGWDIIAIFADDPTVFDFPDRPGVVCGPADPGFDQDAFEALLEATQTDVSSWVYPITTGVDARSAPRADAPVVEKVGPTFIRVLASEEQQDAAAEEFVRVLLPSGKTSFVDVAEIAPLGAGQFCYIKEDGAWKIAGVIGGVEQ
jgi:hypothetical protein